MGVVVDDAHRLHPGVDDGGADELETPTFHFFGDLLGQRRSNQAAVAVPRRHLVLGNTRWPDPHRPALVCAESAFWPSLGFFAGDAFAQAVEVGGIDRFCGGRLSTC